MANKVIYRVAFFIMATILLIRGNRSFIDDYWSSSFDKGANCKKEEVVTDLMNSLSKQCEVHVNENDQTAFQNCKQKLIRHLLHKCHDTRVKDAGELLYCKKRGTINCCFSNYTCEENWENIEVTFQAKAVKFRNDTEASLEDLEKEGYEKCHKLDGLDASVCADDCAKAEKSQFAKNCTKSGGFFKCCVRRDKMHCTDCNFCCSLPICTTKSDDVYTQHSDRVLETKDQHFKLSALEKFDFPPFFYKNEDVRCLKIDKSKNPEDWPYYVHDDFKNAMSKEDLEKAKEVAFDINFNNFGDPKVLKRFIGKDLKKYWQETYGFDHAEQVDLQSFEKAGSKGETLKRPSIFFGARHCLKEELGEYGKNCKKSGGLFRCCSTEYNLAAFQEVYTMLAEAGLSSESENFCMKNGSNKCVISVATSFCSKLNQTNNNVELSFKIPTKPKFEFGGVSTYANSKMRGMRTYYCYVLNTCESYGTIPYKTDDEVFDKSSLCQSFATIKQPEDAVKKKTYKYLVDQCKKQKYDSVMLCNPKHFETQDSQKIHKKVRRFLRDRNRGKRGGKKSRGDRTSKRKRSRRFPRGNKRGKAGGKHSKGGRGIKKNRSRRGKNSNRRRKRPRKPKTDEDIQE